MSSVVELLLRVVLLAVRFRLLTESAGQPSSGLLAIRLASDGASEQMDMRATAASCSRLGKRLLFLTRPSSSSSIRPGFNAPPASSRGEPGELLLDRIPESESFFSRMSEQRPGDGGLARPSLWRSGVVLSASSGPESSSLGSLW